MAIFIKSGKLLVDGDKYESDFSEGAECPKGLEKQALSKGMIEAPKKTGKKINA